MKIVALLILPFAILSAPRSDPPNPYFHAIYCKALSMVVARRAMSRDPQLSVTRQAIERALRGYVDSGAKTSRQIDDDLRTFIDYSRLEGDYSKEWRACVRHYAAGQ